MDNVSQCCSTEKGVNRKVNVTAVLWKAVYLPLPGAKRWMDYWPRPGVILKVDHSEDSSSSTFLHNSFRRAKRIIRIVTSILTDITNGNCSARSNVVMEMVLVNGQIFYQGNGDGV